MRRGGEGRAASLIPATLRRHRCPADGVLQRLRRPVEHDRALRHADDAVGEAAREIHIVHVDDHRNVALAGAARDQLHDLDRGLGVERRGRLVGEHEVGLLHQRARDADALALPARELIGALGGEIGEADGIEQLEGALDVGGWKFAQPGAPRRHVTEPTAQHVLDHREPLDQIVLLEDHADVAAHGAQLRPRKAARYPAHGTGSRLRSARPAG